MIASDSWLNALAIRRRIVPERVYWVIFALLILSAAAFRGFWIYVLQAPFVFPDTHSYIKPILTHWVLPFGQQRTSGTSMFISAALAIFRDPAGILILNSILAVGSAVLLALAIKTVLKQNVLSLFVLFMAAFTAKNISFEFYLLSEHYARVLYVVYAALMLWFLPDPRRLWIAALIGLAVVLNVLVKPSALVLVVATLIAFTVVAWISTGDHRQIAVGGLVFLAISILPLLGYMVDFKARYGTFSLTQSDGMNQFSHVGHLTVLDGGKHPVLKERLKPLLGPYAEKYAAKGIFYPNWLIYGSSNDDLRRDFGNQSPERTIKNYVAELYGSRDIRWANQVYGDLAFEAMLARPAEYLRYAARSAISLWTNGLSFTYYVISPSVERLPSHREDRAIQREWYYKLYGENPPPCSAGPVVPAAASGPLVGLFHGAIASCAALPYDEPSIQKAAERVDRIYRVVTNPLRNNFSLLVHAGILTAILAALMLPLLRVRRAFRIYAFGLLLGLVVLGYTILHGLVNVAEAQRMTANVQDYVVVASCAFMLCTALCFQRLLLYAIALRRKRNWMQRTLTGSTNR
jgi:hypothetical protein